MSKRDVVVLGIARSAIGSFGGGLADIEPCELAGTVMKEAISRSGVDPKAINYVTVGNTIPTESRFPYVARVASIQAGLSQESVAMALNRLCSSGLQAIVTTAQNILLNDCDYGIGGGVEVMSRAGYLSAAMRNGARMGDSKMIDTMVSTLTDPFGVETTMESLAKLKPAFKKEGGSVTAGNASGINDGAAFFVLADAAVAASAGHKPMARLVSYAIAGVPNEIMGEGPIPATKLALKKAGLTLDQIDVIEANEAFAAQAIAVARGLELDMSKTNV